MAKNFKLFKTQAHPPIQHASHNSAVRAVSKAWEKYILCHLRLIAIFGGSLVVTIWTLLRHFGNGVNYDVIGQLSLMDQWAYGLHHGAQVGSTNYLLKMPIYYFMNGLEFVTPRTRLLILVLLFNVATFLLLFKVIDKYLSFYHVKDKSWFYIGMVWLSTISGRVFWLDYPNSRNLETVGGILLFYLIIRFSNQPTRWRALVVAGLGGIVFFADPLQLYEIGIPIALYYGARCLLRRTSQEFTNILKIWSAVSGGYVISRALFWITAHTLPVTYLREPVFIPAITFNNMILSLNNTALSTLTIFDGDFIAMPHNLNYLRRILNALIVVGVVVVIYQISRAPNNSRIPRGILFFMIITISMIYIASGQALRSDTSRYLIMLPLLTLVLIATWGGQYLTKYKSLFQITWFCILIINSVILVGALFITFPNRYSKETYTLKVQSFMSQNNFKYALVARSIALPTNYYADRKLFILPLVCTPDHNLKKTYLFFDKAGYERVLGSDLDVPIILQNDAVTQGSSCRSNDIIRQFGAPQRHMQLRGIGEVLVYNTRSIHLD